MTGDEVTRVSLGGGRRRWWPYVAVGVAVWIGAAIVIGSGGADGDAGGPTTTATTSTTERPRRTTTTVASLAGQAPLLGRRTGWSLVVGDTIVDLDTGSVTPWPEGDQVIASRPDGVFTSERGSTTWWPFPFSDETAVEIGTAQTWVLPVAGAELAWVVRADESRQPRQHASLASLADGDIIRSTELPLGANVVGLAGPDLVVHAGGDGFVFTATEARHFDGQPEATLDGQVLVRRCQDDLRCGYAVVDPMSGASRPVPALDNGDWYLAGMTSGGPYLLAVQRIDDLVERAALVGVDGLRPAFPREVTARDSLWAATWTPDGEWLVVPFANHVYVVDPFADGGPSLVAEFPFLVNGHGPLAVVGAR